MELKLGRGGSKEGMNMTCERGGGRGWVAARYGEGGGHRAVLTQYHVLMVV